MREVAELTGVTPKYVQLLASSEREFLQGERGEGRGRGWRYDGESLLRWHDVLVSRSRQYAAEVDQFAPNPTALQRAAEKCQNR